LRIADGRHAHGRRELADAAGHVIVLEIAFEIDGHVQRNARAPGEGDLLQPVEVLGVSPWRDADAERLAGKVGLRDREVAFRFLEVLVDLRVAPVEVLAGLYRVWLETEAAAFELRDLFDRARCDHRAAPGERQKLAYLLRQAHFRQFPGDESISRILLRIALFDHDPSPCSLSRLGFPLTAV